MASFRQSIALFASLLLAGPTIAAEPALTVETIVAKARAALAPEPAALAKVKSLRFEFSALDDAGRRVNTSTLTVAAPGYRLEKTEGPTTGAESAMGIGRLEGWVSRKSDRLAARSLRALPYENFRKMQDMAADDLAFFAVPDAARGRATYQGAADIDGRKTHAVEYAYASGFRITRHFAADTFVLVASDQLTPKGELQRQKVEGVIVADGIAFPAKETVFVAGKKSGTVAYGRVTVNPELPAGLFDFPSF
jgi:outer membrane lipoprotein-sorting protein